MSNILEDTAITLGYKPKGYGFVKQTENNRHWITIFDFDSCQFYCYEGDNADFGYIYSSGVLQNITDKEFIILACLLLRNHK